jgi:hypothetical protein
MNIFILIGVWDFHFFQVHYRGSYGPFQQDLANQKLAARSEQRVIVLQTLDFRGIPGYFYSGFFKNLETIELLDFHSCKGGDVRFNPKTIPGFPLYRA